MSMQSLTSPAAVKPPVMVDRSKLAHIPGDEGWPLVGRTLNVLADPKGEVDAMARKYGLVYRSRVLGETSVSLLGPEANEFMLRHLAKKIGIDSEKMPVNIDRFGNTSSASIPLLITTDLSARIKATEMQVMMVGFGVGYSWGAAYFEQLRLRCAETVTL